MSDDKWIEEVRASYELFKIRERRRQRVLKIVYAAAAVLGLTAGVALALWRG